MKYTTEKLNSLIKKEIYEIARDIATDKGIAGISKFTKEKLINFIAEHQTQEIIEFTSVPTPKDFFNLVSKLDSKLKVNKACNALLDLLAEKYSTATVSRKLSEYKKLFYSFQHDNPKLNETVTTKKGTNTQHIAANLLTLSSEQSKELIEDRQQNEATRLGIDKDGDVRDIELPPQNIESIVKKTCNLITSSNAVDIACGLLPLTHILHLEK